MKENHHQVMINLIFSFIIFVALWEWKERLTGMGIREHNRRLLTNDVPKIVTCRFHLLLFIQSRHRCGASNRICV